MIYEKQYRAVQAKLTAYIDAGAGARIVNTGGGR
jgi:hypothetical protein